MKRLAISVIVMLLALPAMGQKTDWKKFGELLSEGSYKSAYAEAEAVYKKTKNSTDLLTAAWCMTAAASAYQENAIEDAVARYRAILPRLDAVDRAVCYAFLGVKDSALMDAEILKRTPSDRIKIFCGEGDEEFGGINLTPTAFDVVVRSLMNNAVTDTALLQKLVDFHKDDSDEIRAALDYQMMDVRDYGVIRESDKMKMVQGYINKYRGSKCPFVAHFYNEMAHLMEGCDDMLAAVRYCDTAEARFPGSEGAAECANLRMNICRSKIEMSCYGDDAFTIYPGRPSLKKLTYANLNRIYFRLYPYGGTDMKEYMKNLPMYLKHWEEAVEDDGSHKQHSLIFDLPPMKAGNYLLVASKDTVFDNHDAAIVLLCTDIQLLNTEFGEYMMVDAMTGAPIEGQEVVILTSKGEPLDTLVTYPDGRFRVENNNTGKIRIERDGAVYIHNSWASYTTSTSYMKHDVHTLVDRPVYRLGDTVRFAAVLYESNGVEGHTLPGHAVKVKLINPNYEDHEVRELTSDDYGVVSTTFVIPRDAMAGMWDVNVYEGENYLNSFPINVEEYKQPKFMVTLDPQTPSLSDPQKPAFGKPYTIKGLAQAYSGAMVSGAKVKYIISRELTWYSRCRCYDLSQKNYYPDIESNMILDSTETAADGSFDITFTPWPDSSINFACNPIFNYIIFAEVTDINGETHEARTYVKVGFLNEEVQLVQSPDASDPQHLSYSYYDLNSQPLQGDVTIKVVRLRRPDVLRFTPEIILLNPMAAKTLDSAEFRNLFPQYNYTAGEGNVSTWATDWEYTMTHHADGTRQTYTVELPVKKMRSGVYRIVVAAGEVSDTQRVTLVLPDERKLPNASLLWGDVKTAGRGTGNRLSAEVGENVVVRYASAFDGTRLFYMLTGPDGREIESRWLTAGRKIQTLSIPVDKSMLGGFQVTLHAVREGLKEEWTRSVNVPFSHKQLKVEISTFRDKLQPGEQEQWTIKVESGEQRVESARGQELPTIHYPLPTLIMTMYDDALNSYGGRSVTSFSPWRSLRSHLIRGVSFSGDSKIFKEPFEWQKGKDPKIYGMTLQRGLFGEYFAEELEDEVVVTTVLEIADAGDDNVGSSARGEDDMVTMQSGVRKSKGNSPKEVTTYIEIGAPESGMRLTSEDVARMPGNSVESIVASVGGLGYSDGGKPSAANQPVQIRTNLSTLAFFVSDLRTDSTGTATYSFRVPELLTRWSVRGVAFTNDLIIGSLDKSLVTSKSLMVQPNIPRFIRHGDSLMLMAKVVNLTDVDRQVKVWFNLNDQNNQNNQNTPITQNTQTVVVPAQGSAQVAFPISNIPDDLFVATYEIVARTLDNDGEKAFLSDGERGQIPVVSSRQAVTLSQPLYINGKGKKSFTFHLPSFTSTAKPHFLAAELTTDPMWLAVKAMPYLKEQENPSNIYLANSLYVNTLSRNILKDLKGLKDFKDLTDTANTRLKINEDIKQTLLEATPWLRDAESEIEQRQAIANYFDSATLSTHHSALITQLEERQNPDGGWGWMPECESSLWSTEQILKRLSILEQSDNLFIEQVLAYVDREEQRQYEKFVKPYLKKYQWQPDNIEYLYIRSFYGKGTTEAYKFYYQNALKNYKKYDNLYTQAQLALVFQRGGDSKAARDLIRRLKEKALVSDEMGMYWRDNRSGWCWYERPIETQALLIQAFREVTPQDASSIALMQQWLLKQKQTTRWESDRATVDAISALMPQNTQNIPNTQNNPISLTVFGAPFTAPAEGLEGYRTQRWSGADLDTLLTRHSSLITLKKETSGIAWGAVYFQYTDDMDKIPSTASGITLKRSYLNQNNQNILNGQNTPKVGDCIKVRIEISVDRTMEYLELIDGRPSCVEPISTRSGWCWNQGLRYYVEVKNTATHCYINRLEKGKYIVEYEVYVTNPGAFLAGPVTMQCMYAPEFRATAPAEQISVD